jgi:hypothetical protein
LINKCLLLKNLYAEQITEKSSKREIRVIGYQSSKEREDPRSSVKGRSSAREDYQLGKILSYREDPQLEKILN